VRGAPYHPMTQGKIERWHQTLKNRILLVLLRHKLQKPSSDAALERLKYWLFSAGNHCMHWIFVSF
jgi:transposase InsO family protein